jgi:hypothetical protein
MASEMLGGILLANIAALLALNTPAVISAGLNHLHAISQICTIGVLGPTIAVSVRCLMRPPGGGQASGDRAPLLWAGALWGLAYLARAETIFAAAVFFLMCGLVQFRAGRLRHALIPVATFLVFFVPYAAWVSISVKQHNLLAGKTIYQFYNSQGWSDPRPNPPTDDIEKEGYIYAQELYGTPEENSESVLRAMVRNPQALLSRIDKNVQALYALAMNKAYVPPYFPYLLVLSPLAFLWVRPSHPQFPALLFFLGASAAVSSLLLLHIDARYPTVFIPFMVMSIVMLISGFTRLPLGGDAARNIAGIVIFALMAYRLPQLGKTAAMALPAERFELKSLRAIGTAFLDTVRPTADERRHIHVSFDVRNERLDLRAEDTFMLHYFTRTTLPLGGVDEVYPRWRIFSFLPCLHTHSISFADDKRELRPKEPGVTGIKVHQVAVEGVGKLNITEVLRGKDGRRSDTCERPR